MLLAACNPMLWPIYWVQVINGTYTSVGTLPVGSTWAMNPLPYSNAQSVRSVNPLGVPRFLHENRSTVELNCGDVVVWGGSSELSGCAPFP